VILIHNVSDSIAPSVLIDVVTNCSFWLIMSEEVPVIVMDNGSGISKVGFACIFNFLTLINFLPI
jgi:hypothetical protein